MAVVGGFDFEGDALPYGAFAIAEGEQLGQVLVEQVYLDLELLFLNWKERVPGKRMFSLTRSISTTLFIACSYIISIISVSYHHNNLKCFVSGSISPYPAGPNAPKINAYFWGIGMSSFCF